MKILICAAGSHGDVLPFIALGKEFGRRGHEVRLIANAAFGPMANEAGLPFRATGEAAELAALIADGDSTDPRKGLALVARALMEATPRAYQGLCDELDTGRTIIIGSSFALAARLVAETHQVPCVTVHLSPSWLRSEHMAPSLGPLGHLEWAPRGLKRWLWKIMDKRFLDPLFTAPFNRIRADLKLPPVQRVLHEWIHSADLTLGMFPEAFAARQPDWPHLLQLPGFPLYDHGGDAPLPAAVEAFLAAGEAPVAFTTGTANAASHAFFAEAAQACRLANRRGILLTQSPQQLPASLPNGVVHFDYVPFKALLPRLAAFVHHGGIGSTSQALRAGVPQLIRPMAFDQFDNASRAVRLGVARQLLPKRFSARSAARALDELITSASVKQSCSRLANRMTGVDGISSACDAVLRLQPES